MRHLPDAIADGQLEKIYRAVDVDIFGEELNTALHHRFYAKLGGDFKNCDHIRMVDFDRGAVPGDCIAMSMDVPGAK
jgi:hypothetical protein